MRGDDMKQKMQYIQTLKQTLKLNQKLLKSLDFLTDNIDDINKVIQDILETNPFLGLYLRCIPLCGYGLYQIQRYDRRAVCLGVD